MTDPGAGGETYRLFAAVQEWAQRTLPAPPSGHAGPECEWCPLCQLASVLRGEHSEIAERAGEAGAAVAGALRALLDSAARGGGPAPQPAADAQPPPPPRPRVQRIVLDDAPTPDRGRG